MSEPTKLRLSPEMLRGLLQGPTPVHKEPEVVEVMTTDGCRMCFNVDAIEVVWEGLAHEKGQCFFRLKGLKEVVGAEMPYDEFLREIHVTPRTLAGCEADPRG